MDINVDFLQWFIISLIKTSSRIVKNEITSNKELEKNCTKQLLENLIKKVYSPLIDNIWGADLPDTQLISKFNKGFRFLCVIDIYSKYAWFIPLKGKRFR